MPGRRNIILIIGLIATSYVFFLVYVKFIAVSPSSVTINGHKIRIEIADNQEKHFKGLSNREKLCDDCGMLFVFNDRVQRAFVMRNMKFSLDIIYIDGERIVKIFENLKPEGESPSALYQSGQPITKVLEVNAGTAKKYDFKTGDIVK